MIAKVMILKSAEYDLQELKKYMIRDFSREVWQERYNKLKDTLQNLQRFPHLDSVPAELEKLSFNQYRQVLSDMNRIIYEIRHNIIYIHMMVDTRRDMASLLQRRLLQRSI
jgi:plasmid stabilization system protein ParE